MKCRRGFSNSRWGRRLKYSSGLWPVGRNDAAAAEEAMLELTCERAKLADGQHILELGCGWGSLSLWMAEHYPNARITARLEFRNAKAHIDAEAARRGFGNLTIITQDMNRFDAAGNIRPRGLGRNV